MAVKSPISVLLGMHPDQGDAYSFKPFFLFSPGGWFTTRYTIWKTGKVSIRPTTFFSWFSADEDDAWIGEGLITTRGSTLCGDIVVHRKNDMPLVLEDVLFPRSKRRYIERIQEKMDHELSSDETLLLTDKLVSDGGPYSESSS